MSKEEKVPFETMLFSGVTFKVINRHEAHKIIGDLTDFKDQKIYNVFEDTWRFPDYEENPIFLLAEEDVEMDLFEMDFSTEEHPDIFILGFIFKGNLNVTKLISSYDTDNSPALIVLGETTTVNITLFGSVHYLGGGLKCDVLAGEYNHGELFVKGDVTAWLIYSDDMWMHFERFTDVQAIVNVNRPDVLICGRVTDTDGAVIIVENYFPSTHQLSDIVNDDFIEYTSYGTEILGNNYLDVFKEGLSIIDYDKTDRYLFTDFRNQFIEMVQILSEKNEGRIRKTISETEYQYVPFVYEGMNYSQISEEIGNGFNIQMRALWCHDNEEIMLILEYQDEEGNPKHQWINNETAPGIEMYCVKVAAIKAFEVLTAETDSNEDEDEDEDNETEYAEYDSSFSLEDFAVQFGNYTIPEDLVKLYEFQEEYGSETYSECFGLLVTNDKTGIKTWSEEEEFYNSFIEFAGANGSGSSYAYWLIDDDLNNCPIVVFGDEGGIHVVAENTRKLIHLLTLDTEISVDFDYCYFYKDEEYYSENENKEEFHNWVKREFNLDAIESNEETEIIINEAKEKYKTKLNDFLTKFGIEIGEEEE